MFSWAGFIPWAVVWRRLANLMYKECCKKKPTFHRLYWALA